MSSISRIFCWVSMSKALRAGDVVAVVWVDSHSPIDRVWTRVEELDNECPMIISLGRVHVVDRQAVTLVASWSETHDGEVGGVVCIPRCAVLSVTQLALGP